MAEAVLGTHDDWQIGKTKIFLKVSALCPGCHGSAMSRALPTHGMFLRVLQGILTDV